MIINEISIKGYKSFGNTEQTLKLNKEKGELILLAGSNGNGKSISPKTLINIDIPLESFNLKEFLNFLEIMGEENVYIKYIKENNKLLYEEYINSK